MRGSHLALISVLVPDYDAALSFYVGVLGFELREDRRLSEHKRWVVVAPAGSECAVLLARANGARQAAAIGNQAGGRVFLFLHTDDFVRDHRMMQANGVHFTEAPRDESYGMVVVFEDPFGNRWDLVQPHAA